MAERASKSPSRTLRVGLIGATLGGALGCIPIGSLPASPAAAAYREAASPDQAAIERQPVCVGSSVASVGTLADTLYYRAALLDDGKIAVGYFAFYSEERPWGNNWLTWTFLPALGIDLVYSRTLLVAPGLQRAMYGRGDVEGFRIIYEVAKDGSFRVDHAVADDGNHHPVLLARAEVLAFDPTMPTVYSDVWSHQLGGHGARSKDELASHRCYVGDSIRPLSDEITRDFRVDLRAPPAHVERLGGLPLDARTRRAQATVKPGG